MSKLKFKFKMPDDESLAGYISVKGEKGEKGDPTKLSQLENDTGFVAANTTALTNYYTKAQTDSAIDADVGALKTELGVPGGFFTDTGETVSGEGSSITLNGTANAVFRDIKLYGDTRQEGTPTPENPVEVQTVTGEQTIIISDNDQQSQSYTLSLGELELCDIKHHNATYRDFIHGNEGKWYKHKEVGKTVVNTANITLRSYTNVVYAQIATPSDAKSYDNHIAYGVVCSHARYHSGISWDSATGINLIFDTPVKQNYWVGFSPDTSIDTIRERLEECVIYYPLATPIEEEITDETLIEQLNSLVKANSYNDITVITISGQLSARLAVTAHKNNWSGTISGINSELDRKADEITNAQKPYYFNDVDGMKAHDLHIGDMAVTAGYYSSNDGGGAKYTITDSGTEDGGSIITLNNGLKAQLIVENGTINVRQFGAKGDGTTDDTTAIQNAINFAQNFKATVFLSDGTYLITSISATKTIRIIGNGYNTVLKSAANSSAEAMLTLLNDGHYKSEVAFLRMDGSKDNNTSEIDGIKLYVNASGWSGDKYTYLHDLTVKNISGNGIVTQGDKTGADIREIRLYNIEIGSCNKNGLYFRSCTDSLYSFVTSHNNLMNGYDMTSGPHKMLNCKAFWNGKGDEETLEDAYRIPASAFTITSDSAYNPAKTYYTRSGSGGNNDWYVFTKFEGDSFESGTDYYEMTTPYYKRYAGFQMDGSSLQMSNCEAQDNYGDGINISGGSDNILNAIVCDNNGFLNASYQSKGLEQLYYGVFCSSWQTTIIGAFRNFRYNSIGASQKAPLMIRNCGIVSGILTSSNQVSADVFMQNTYPDKIEIVNQGYPQAFNADLSSISMISQTLSFSGNDNYIRQQSKVNYIYATLKDTEGFALSTTEKELFTLPALYRPNRTIIFEANLAAASGWRLNGESCTVIIYTSGKVTVRANTAEQVSDAQYLNINFTYPRNASG